MLFANMPPRRKSKSDFRLLYKRLAVLFLSEAEDDDDDFIWHGADPTFSLLATGSDNFKLQVPHGLRECSQEDI